MENIVREDENEDDHPCICYSREYFHQYGKRCSVYTTCVFEFQYSRSKRWLRARLDAYMERLRT